MQESSPQSPRLLFVERDLFLVRGLHIFLVARTKTLVVGNGQGNAPVYISIIGTFFCIWCYAACRGAGDLVKINWKKEKVAIHRGWYKTTISTGLTDLDRQALRKRATCQSGQTRSSAKGFGKKGNARAVACIDCAYYVLRWSREGCCCIIVFCIVIWGYM